MVASLLLSRYPKLSPASALYFFALQRSSDRKKLQARVSNPSQVRYVSYAKLMVQAFGDTGSTVAAATVSREIASGKLQDESPKTNSAQRQEKQRQVVWETPRVMQIEAVSVAPPPLPKGFDFVDVHISFAGRATPLRSSTAYPERDFSPGDRFDGAVEDMELVEAAAKAKDSGSAIPAVDRIAREESSTEVRSDRGTDVRVTRVAAGGGFHPPPSSSALHKLASERELKLTPSRLAMLGDQVVEEAIGPPSDPNLAKIPLLSWNGLLRTAPKSKSVTAWRTDSAASDGDGEFTESSEEEGGENDDEKRHSVGVVANATTWKTRDGSSDSQHHASSLLNHMQRFESTVVCGALFESLFA